MLKDIIKRKIIIIVLSLSIFLLTILFPDIKPISYETNLSYNVETFPLYITNKDHVVSLIKVPITENDIIKLARNIISYLTIGSENANYLPDSFLPTIPQNTRINNIKIDNNILIIDFSNEFLLLKKENARSTIEAIVYSLLEIDNVDGVVIYVDNNLLTTIPNTSESLRYPLTRKMGTNIISKINDVRNTVQTTSYYLAKEKDYSYYIPVTTIQNSNKNKIEIVIEELKSHPHIKTNLISYLNASTQLTNYEILAEEIKLSFSNLLDEEVIEETTYVISLSLRDTLDIAKVEIAKSLE